MSEPYRKVDEIISNIFENISTDKMNEEYNLTNDSNLLNINKLNQSLFYSNSTRQ